VLCRVGGDEFAVVLPESTLEGAKQFSDRLSGQIAGKLIEGVGGVTVSSGIVELAGREDSKAFLWRAGDALFKGKRGESPPDDASGVREPRHPKPSSGGESVEVRPGDQPS